MNPKDLWSKLTWSVDFAVREEDVREFIEEHVDAIEEEDWFYVFSRMWNTSEVISKQIINFLRVAEIQWDEITRQEQVIKELIWLFESKFNNGEKIYLYDLYNLTTTAGFRRSWLGYSEAEFYNVVVANENKLAQCCTIDGFELTIKH